MSGTGIRVAASDDPDTSRAVSAIRAELGAGPHQHILVFYSKNRHDAERLCIDLAEAFVDVPISGCSSAGELTPLGMQQGGIVAFAFPADGFRIYSDIIECLEVESIAEVTKRLLVRAGIENPRNPSPGYFAILLADGVSNREEYLVAAVAWELSGIPLVGGSAGDDQNYRSTDLIHLGNPRKKSAILIVGHTDFPFQTFRTHNMRSTPTKLVVTRADPDNRIIYELNAEPAAIEYANAIGMPTSLLHPLSFESYSLAVKVADNCYCRSIRRINADGSLLFFCAVDEGLVFTAALPEDIVKSTEVDLERVQAELGEIDVILGFDCLFRRLDAEKAQSRHLLEKLYKDYKVVGFNTYGEQCDGMHLNQTLTCIAFGSGRK